MEEELRLLESREQELVEELAAVRQRISGLKEAIQAKAAASGSTIAGFDLDTPRGIQALVEAVKRAKATKGSISHIESDARRIALHLNSIAAAIDDQPRALRVVAIQALLMLSEEMPVILQTITEA